jgi:hypothetical protein
MMTCCNDHQDRRPQWSHQFVHCGLNLMFFIDEIRITS